MCQEPLTCMSRAPYIFGMDTTAAGSVLTLATKESS